MSLVKITVDSIKDNAKKELVKEFLELCDLFDLEVLTDSDGLYIPGPFTHTCIFVNCEDDDQEWVRFVASFEGVHYRCDVDKKEELFSAMSYWTKGDDMDHQGLSEWCTDFYDPNKNRVMS